MSGCFIGENCFSIGQKKIGCNKQEEHLYRGIYPLAKERSSFFFLIFPLHSLS